MYAVIRTGGKQVRITENAKVTVERLPGEKGDVVALTEILMLGGAGETLIGSAVPAEARVFAEILDQSKGEKILVFKKRRRKNFRRLNGHRQLQTELRIAAISPTGEPPAGKDAIPAPLAPEEPAVAPPAAPDEPQTEA